MTELILILLATALANNLVTDHLLGTSPMLAAAQRLDVAFDMATTVTGITTVVAITTWLLDKLLITPLNLENYRLLVLVMTIAGVGQALRAMPGEFCPRLFDRDGRFYPLLLLNCTLLGVILLGAQQDAGPLGALAYGAGAGLGYSLVLLGFTAINLRLEATDLPAPVRGLPLQVITLGVISLSFTAIT